jgi:F-type H+-transporting ATPase subunit delta
MAEAATIARPYAKAAFMSARDAKTLGAWSDALQKSAGLVADARIADLITNPKMSVDQVVSMFAGLGGAPSGDMDVHWQNFVRLLTQNKRLEVLPAIADQFEMLKAQYENELDVQVTSAVAMNAQQEAKLAEALKKRFKRDVRISSAVDASLLGGAVIRAGDLVIDGSINGRLQRLASDLAN